MTSKPDFKFKLTDSQRSKVAALAKKSGLTTEQWFEREADKVVRRLVDGSSDLTPKEAAIELNLSAYTVRRYVADGKFPGAFALTERAIRIPRADVEKLKNDRLLRVA